MRFSFSRPQNARCLRCSAIAARIGLRVSAVPYPLAQADTALRDLRQDRVNGAAVLVV